MECEWSRVEWGGEECEWRVNGKECEGHGVVKWSEAGVRVGVN